MSKLTKLARIASAAVLFMSAAASAQEVQRIAAVVNDEVISVFDLAQRIRIVLVSSNVEPTPEQRQRAAPGILRRLIDERLRIQEADRQNVRVTDRDMARGGYPINGPLRSTFFAT